MASDSARRVVIVGGVAAGMSAATRLRRNDESLEIVVFERGEHVSFANCGLPYHVGGVIARRKDLLLQTPRTLASRFGLDVRVRHEVVSIDRAGRSLQVLDRGSGEVSTEPYDVLVLATGASPVLPPLPGISRARTLRDVADADALITDLDLDRPEARRPTSATILGGGFIGLELAENLTRRGLRVTVVERADQILTPLDPEMAQPVLEHLERAGVRVLTGLSAVAVEDHDVLLSDGSRSRADLLVAAIGVVPESALAREAGLEIGERGGVVVDAHLRTSDPHVFAVGDVAQKQDTVGGGATLVPLAQTANRHGRLVADMITGRRVSALPVLATAIVSVFDLMVATTGWNERRLRAAGRSIRVIHTHPASHATYYPGADAMSLKLLVDAESDEILGAQGVGKGGVDKRIDVIATAMRAGLRASDLADLELAYAPQFGSAKDPVNMLGMIADNLITGAARTVQWHQLADLVHQGVSLLDVRTAREFERGAIPGALNVPVDELRERIGELPPGRLAIYCAAGQRGHVAARLLSQRGWDVVNLDGGYRTWIAGQQTRSEESEAAA